MSWYAGAQVSSVLVSEMHAKRTRTSVLHHLVPSITPATSTLDRVTTHLTTYTGKVATCLR